MISMDMFFNGWGTLLRTLIIGGIAYVALVVMLRLSGKRTLGKMNSFDLIVTVALGSTLATVLLTKEVALAEGTLALALLILLQLAITWLSVRTKLIRNLARAEPSLLFSQGEFLRDVMKGARVTESEVLQAIRSSGSLALGDIAAVVLETDGSFSVVNASDSQGKTSLDNVHPSPDSARASNT
jgi:uncharacterized membrane protein YcaP (DUF421 family)